MPYWKDTHKKMVFLVVGPLRFYPPYTNGLVVHTLFFSLTETDFDEKKNSPIFELKNPDLLKKKKLFLLSGRGGGGLPP